VLSLLLLLLLFSNSQVQNLFVTAEVFSNIRPSNLITGIYRRGQHAGVVYKVKKAYNCADNFIKIF